MHRGKISTLESWYMKLTVMLMIIMPSLSGRPSLRKLAHAIYRDSFQGQKLKISLEKIMIFSILLLKTLIVSTHIKSMFWIKNKKNS